MMAAIPNDARLVDAARRFAASLAQPAKTSPGIPCDDLEIFANRKFPSREPFVDPWLCRGDAIMIYGPRGAGKTQLVLGLSLAIAAGVDFLGWRIPKPRRTLHLDFEMTGATLQLRILLHLPQKEPAPGYFRIFASDLLDMGEPTPDLSTVEGQSRVDAVLGDAEFVVIDNLSSACRTGRENEAESWTQMASWINALRRRGIAVLTVHHAGKSGQQRGTSRREDQLDTVIALRRPSDYAAEQGAKFELHFEKSRHLSGSAVQSLMVEMTVAEDCAAWRHSTLEVSTTDKIRDLAVTGLTPGEICADLGIHKSTVCRALKGASADGTRRPTARGGQR